jgi:hypothetical protein
MAALPPPHAESKAGGDRIMEVTTPVLAGQRFLDGLRAEQLDALAATASEVVFPAGQGG